MILAVLQARVSSSRLPRKVLKPILGEPMLFRQIERIRRSKRLDQLVVATSTDPSDDPLAEACQSRGIALARGSLNDVLQRFVDACGPYAPDTVVRLTGDCPLFDWEVLDQTIELFQSGGYDYACNCEPPTFPDGLDAEVMRYDALLQAHKESVLPSEREHVTQFIRKRPERFRLGNLVSPQDLSALRWTVDEPEDFAFVEAVYTELYAAKPDFLSADILELMARVPTLGQMNQGIIRNEGLLKSLQADKVFLEETKS